MEGARGEAQCGEDTEGKGGQMCSEGKRLDFGWWTHNIQMLYYNAVHLKCVLLISIPPRNVNPFLFLVFYQCEGVGAPLSPPAFPSFLVF